MRSPVDFICEPVDGRRYSNTRKIGNTEVVFSTSMEDHRFTNRFAKVIQTPNWYKGDIKPGDSLIVHHNTFRLFYDHEGNVKSDRPYLRDGLFLVSPDQVYGYISGDDKFAVEGFCFVEPVSIKGDLILEMKGYTPLHGTVRILDNSMRDQGLTEGDTVIFTPDSEYEFEIDGTILYRIRAVDLVAKLNTDAG